MLKWQQRYIDYIRGLSDEKLLETVIYDAAGDDYDGCFTTKGRWMFAAIQEELFKRLPDSFKK
jgi:hypothetical protein